MTTKNSEIRMMSDPFSWPNLLLPLKKRGAWEIGFLTGSGPTVFLANIWALSGMSAEERKAIPIKEYPSFEALVDDGWVID